MTFVAAITAISERFLTDRSYQLIVEPALADFEFDAHASGMVKFAPHVAVISALFGAFRDDALNSGAIGTFASLVLIPICYYSFFFLLGLPKGTIVPSGTLTLLGIAVIMLSLAPAIVCYWPERESRNTSTEP